MPDNIFQNVSIQGEGNIVVGKGDVNIHPLPPAEVRLRRDLGILLNNVKNNWIKGVLEKSIYHTTLIELGVETRAEAVDPPSNRDIEGPQRPRETLPRDIKIRDIFNEANGFLLILGEPGSGKTTALLQLARDLIAEVDSAFTQPVPVYLNLSTWTNINQPLDEWLIEELNNNYRLPKRDGKEWLRDRRFLPLLDGLDEVKLENRAACVENINQLAKEYGLQGLVVCSRVKEYTDLDVRLEFDRAIYLQPLTPEQIDEYLDKAGGKLADLRETLQADGALQEMAQSPLILNIMSLAYQDTSSKTLKDPSLNTKDARIKNLFDSYIARMFNRKAGGQEYNTDKSKTRLSWLARNMQRHNQDVFLIENLQPSWLQTRIWRLVYIAASRLLSVLSVGIIVGQVFGFLRVFVFCLITFLFISIIDFLRFEWLNQWRNWKATTRSFWSLVYIASIGLIGLGVDTFRMDSPNEIYFTLIDWSFGGAVGLVVGLIFAMRGSQKSLMNDIQTVESLRWYWSRAIKGCITVVLFVVMFIGLPFGFFYWLIFFPRQVHTLLSDVLVVGLIGLVAGLVGALIFGGIFGLIGGIFYGLSPEITETKNTPNQGIRLSARNAIYGGVLVVVIVGISDVILGLSPPLRIALSGIVNNEFAWSLIAGLLGILWYGGLDIIQHYTLRLILFIQGYTPRNYARFLDYANDRVFLQKVGGGYRFIHRLLMEHFADMAERRQFE